MKPYLLFASLLLCIAVAGQGQTSAPPFKIAMQRVLWHENIDKQQVKLLASIPKTVTDETIQLEITDALGRRIDELQETLETDSVQTNMVKIKHLRNVESTLQQYANHRGQKDFPASSAPALIKALAASIELDGKGESIGPVVAANDYGVGKMLVDGMAFSTDNPGMAASRNALILKYVALHPDEILQELRKNPNVPFADSLLKVAAHRDTRKFYDYAQARGTLSKRIASHADTLVRTIGQMAGSRNGQLYFPFLDNLIRGRITLNEIDSVKEM